MSAHYCGRNFSEQELAQIRWPISDNPGSSRAALSRLTCRLLQWYKADGGLKEMSAWVAMLRMQENGLITLPPPRSKRPDPTVHLNHRTDPATPVDLPTGKLAPLALRRVQKKANSRLWVDICSCNIDIHHIPVDQRVYPTLPLSRPQAPTRRPAALLHSCRGAAHCIARFRCDRLADRAP